MSRTDDTIRLVDTNGDEINPSTEEKQTEAIAKLGDIETALANVKIDTGDIDLNTDGLEGLITDSNTKLDTLEVDKATAANQDTANTALSKLIGLEIPAHDSIALTYVATGDGAGEIETVVYKSGVATVATLTLGYDTSNRLDIVTKS